MTFKTIDKSTWKRNKQYEFFKSFSEPFFGVTFDLDITRFYKEAKTKKEPIFIGYLYYILKSLNEISEFKTRIQGNEVLEFGTIGCSPTIARENGTFGFSYIDFYEDYENFKKLAGEEIERVQRSNDFTPSADKIDTIHFSSIPWLNFTSVSHARHFEFPDSIPKITCGKISKVEEKYSMPISVHAHHALIDGFHIGELQSKLNKYLN